MMIKLRVERLGHHYDYILHDCEHGLSNTPMERYRERPGPWRSPSCAAGLQWGLSAAT